MRTIARYRVSAVLYALYWLVTIRWSIDQLAAASGKTSAFSNGLEILVPILAGGFIAFQGGPITAGMVCGAALGILDFGLLLNTYLHGVPPSSPNYAGSVGIFVPIAVPGLIGGGLGLIGALAGRLLGARWEKSKSVVPA